MSELSGWEGRKLEKPWIFEKRFPVYTEEQQAKIDANLEQKRLNDEAIARQKSALFDRFDEIYRAHTETIFEIVRSHKTRADKKRYFKIMMLRLDGYSFASISKEIGISRKRAKDVYDQFLRLIHLELRRSGKLAEVTKGFCNDY